MKKRLLALSLAALMLLPLAGCGKKETAATDKELVQKRGYIIIGITDFAPMDYQDDKGQWVGFDADMARAFAQSLGVEARFQLIDWDKKHEDLQNGKIDAIWNGMTLTTQVRQQMDVSMSYCHNAQVVVLPADQVALYQDEDSLKSLDFAAEDDSYGAKTLNEFGLVYSPVEDQAQALEKVSSGSVSACIIDQFMAAAMTGPGTQYPNLAVAMELGSEVEDIVVGFRKGSDLVETFNQFWDDSWENGTVGTVAETYNMTSFVLKH